MCEKQQTEVAKKRERGGVERKKVRSKDRATKGRPGFRNTTNHLAQLNEFVRDVSNLIFTTVIFLFNTR